MKDADDNERQSFIEEMGDVIPFSRDDKVFTHSASNSLSQKAKRASLHSTDQALNNPLSMDGAIPVNPHDFIHYQQPGIQDGVFKNLRMGKYELEKRLSLSGLTLKESRDILYSSIRKYHEQGVRAFLIRHGIGENSQPFPGLKKSYVNHWLGELSNVIAWHTAQPCHGGLGATYVLLKKHPEQKLINREKNRKR